MLPDYVESGHVSRGLDRISIELVKGEHKLLSGEVCNFCSEENGGSIRSHGEEGCCRCHL